MVQTVNLPLWALDLGLWTSDSSSGTQPPARRTSSFGWRSGWRRAKASERCAPRLKPTQAMRFVSAHF